MGFPLGSWGDILSRREEFEKLLRPSFFCFVLYKSSDHMFREFILRNFNMLHDQSRDVVFFVLDKPEDWLNREDIDYYRGIYGDSYNPELNDQEVDLVCDYFSIHPNRLPAIITFPNLRSKSCNIFGLKNVDSDNELEVIFETIFLDKDSGSMYKGRRYHNRLYRNSTTLRRRFPNIVSQISYFEDDQNIIEKFEQINSNINLMRNEMKAGFKTIISKLEIIQTEIKPFKLALADKFRELEKLPQSNLKDSEIEELHNMADEDLIKYSNQIVDELGADEFFSLAKYDFLEYFESDSLHMIRSCFITEKLVSKEKISEFDYSLCSVGFWKALEIELNIVLIDTIRFIKKIIETIPSEGTSIKSGKYNIFAGYKWVNNVRKEYKVNINNKKRTRLCSLMFGDLIRVSDNYEKNEFNSILEVIYEETTTMIDVQSFMKDFVEKLSQIVYKYRNECSHTGIMREDDFKKLKNLIFSNDGLYKKISLLKQNISNLVKETHSI